MIRHDFGSVLINLNSKIIADHEKNNLNYNTINII